VDAAGAEEEPMRTAAVLAAVAFLGAQEPRPRPNVILLMTDDQGWGDTSYNGHAVLKTPHLDEMAAAGVRFNRFYAAAPVCSPTRGSVLTGRHPNRFGCFTYGKPIRLEEVTIARAMKSAGYVTGHFGKWHLNGRSGAGVAILADDPLHPGRVGFDEWVSASNFFDLNPSLGRNGKPEGFTGDGSDITIDETLKFVRRAVADKKPFLAVAWFGNPHGPHRALPEDKAAYGELPEKEQNYYGELRGVDRSVGRLRKELRSLGAAENTILWFCSDNGGQFGPTSTGGLRGQKGSLWEGGVRVPGILEWPARVRKPFATDVPASTLDIFPTIADLLGAALPSRPIDGVSLVPLLDGAMERRPKPMPFWVYGSGHLAMIDNAFKLHKLPARGGEPRYELYDLAADPKETTDLAGQKPEVVARLKPALEEWKASVENSLAGKDY
jgi:arylsulfatase A-like enzyme